MKNVLIVVDVQKDFVDGSLGTKQAQEIIPEVCRLIDDDSFDSIIVTMDTHKNDYFNTREGKYLPVTHCIENTEGWQIDAHVSEHLKCHQEKLTVISKPTFGSEKLVELLKQRSRRSSYYVAYAQISASYPMRWLSRRHYMKRTSQWLKKPVLE